MSTMIELVAEAIALKEGAARSWEKVHDQAKEDYRAVAIAAINAMRAPTDAMHSAARDWSDKRYGKPIGQDASTGCWRAMIDAAIDETGDRLK